MRCGQDRLDPEEKSVEVRAIVNTADSKARSGWKCRTVETGWPRSVKKAGNGRERSPSPP